MRNRRTKWLALLAVTLLGAGFSTAAEAQLTFGNENPRQTKAGLIGYTSIDFKPDGMTQGIDTLFAPIAFSGSALNLTYSRANALISFSWGQQPSTNDFPFDVRLIDVHLQVWSELFFSEAAAEGDHRFFLPITLLSNYRDISPDGNISVQSFQTTSLGLGVGAGYYGQLSPNVLLEMRATPELAVGFQSLSGRSGWTRLFDGNVDLHIGPLINKLGITISYAFRATYWDVQRQQGGLAGLPDFSFEPLDFQEQRHTVSLVVY